MSEITVLRVTPDDNTGSNSEIIADGAEVSVIDRSTLTEAKEAVNDTDVDCLITEYDLPDGTGIDLIRYVRHADPDAGCILFTNADREIITAETDDRIVAEYVDKDSPNAEERLADLVSVTARRRTQTSYPLPDNEPERLAALDRLDLDSPSLMRAVERVTDLAIEHFDVERAAVNVITERTQEVLTCRGADWTTIPREETICTHSILNDDVTVIKDTSTDPRFEDYENLAELDIRFYAGAPLTTDGGLPIGTFCIYAAEPRELSSEGEDYLRLLADETIHWIELHSRLARCPGDDGQEEGR